MDETNYLLSSKANAEHLGKSLQQAREGKVFEHLPEALASVPQRGSISPEQAAKLRELVKAVRNCETIANSFIDGSRHWVECMASKREAERQLNAYITSLTGESK